MTLQLIIENPTVTKKTGTSSRTGKPYTIREQTCVVHGAGRFPQETKISLPDEIEGYEAGVYDITTPLTVGRFGFDVSRDLGLKLVKAAPAAASK